MVCCKTKKKSLLTLCDQKQLKLHKKEELKILRINAAFRNGNVQSLCKFYKSVNVAYSINLEEMLEYVYVIKINE
ncbi:hypothetical protein C0J52_05418 [Blattella germanica]|nr:hypothetical protein C0J52_05418 [Blattella germanica]